MAASIAEQMPVAESSAPPTLPGIRIDGAHQLGDAPAQPPPPAEPAAEERSLPAEDNLLEELRQQARQLARHLTNRQRENDAREARLNAQHAALEKESRSERLWILERRAELAEQADDLLRRECDLQERVSRVTAAEEHLGHAQQRAEQEGRQHEEVLQKRSDQMEAVAARLKGQRKAVRIAQRRLQAVRRSQKDASTLERQVLATQRAASLSEFRGLLEGIEVHRTRLMQHEEQLQAREIALCSQFEEESARWAARQEILEQSEQALEREWEQLRQRQEAFMEQTRQEEAARAAAAQDEADQRQQWQAQTIREQQSLERRSQELDARRKELEQLQESLRQLHKETLETRLATEELLGQLSGAVPSAALTSSISRLRRRIDDQFRLAQADLTQQRGELENLRTTLAQRHEQLLAQKVQLEQWVQKREAVIEHQAANLVAREQELDSQQEQVRGLQEHWQEERNGYQREIRRLLAQLRREEVPA